MVMIELIGGPFDGAVFLGHPCPGLIWKCDRHVYKTIGNFKAVYRGVE